MSKADQENNKKPIYKKWWFWVIIVILLIGIGGASTGGNNEPSKVGSSTSTVSEETKEEKTEFAVGDVISYEGKEVTVVSVERNYNTGNEYITPESGKEYVRISVTLENKSDDKFSYGSYDWEIQDSDGDIQSVAGIQYTQDGAMGSGELAAGGKKNADLFFEVPQDDAGLILHYKASFWSNKTIKIKL